MNFFRDSTFLSGIHAYERQLAKLLALLLAAMIGIATIQLFLETGGKLLLLQVNWFDGSLIRAS
jgi:hypothetical protein